MKLLLLAVLALLSGCFETKADQDHKLKAEFERVSSERDELQAQNTMLRANNIHLRKRIDKLEEQTFAGGK